MLPYPVALDVQLNASQHKTAINDVSHDWISQNHSRYGNHPLHLNQLGHVGGPPERGNARIHFDHLEAPLYGRRPFIPA